MLCLAIKETDTGKEKLKKENNMENNNKRYILQTKEKLWVSEWNSKGYGTTNRLSQAKIFNEKPNENICFFENFKIIDLDKLMHDYKNKELIKE